MFFFKKVHRYSESFSNRSVAALFETSVLQEVRNLHNNSTILIRKFQNKVILYFLNYFINDFLTLIRVGVLGLSFVVWIRGWGVNLPRLKLTRIMLETWNLVRKDTHICRFRKYTFSTKTLLILLLSASFLQKTNIFLPKIVPSLKAIVWELCQRQNF